MAARRGCRAVVAAAVVVVVVVVVVNKSTHIVMISFPNLRGSLQPTKYALHTVFLFRRAGTGTSRSKHDEHGCEWGELEPLQLRHLSKKILKEWEKWRVFG